MAAGMLVAAVVHGGVLRHVRGRAMERDRGEGGGRERVRESQGVRGDAGEIQGDGDAGRQGGGGRGACRRAAATRSSSWQGGRRQGRGQVGWAAQVGCQLGRLVARGKLFSLSLISVFYFL